MTVTVWLGLDAKTTCLGLGTKTTLLDLGKGGLGKNNFFLCVKVWPIHPSQPPPSCPTHYRHLLALYLHKRVYYSCRGEAKGDTVTLPSSGSAGLLRILS